VPAQIVDSLSSDDVTVQEGANVSLVCHVTGVPRPEVRWRRMGVTSLQESTELLEASQTVAAGSHSEYSSCQLTAGSPQFVTFLFSAEFHCFYSNLPDHAV